MYPAPMRPPVEYSTVAHDLLGWGLGWMIRACQFGLYWLAKMGKGFIRHRSRVYLTVADLKGMGPYIIASNHQSMLDAFIISSTLPPAIFFRLGPFRYFAHNGLFDLILTPFLLVMGCFPASRNRRYAYGLEAAQSFLSQGQTLMIFPEGRRTPVSIRPRTGIKVLSEKTAAVIIPARIQWHFHRWGLRSYQLTIGRPLTAQNLSARQIMNRIYKLPL